MPITDDQEPTLALTRDLIACTSVTPDDAGCQPLMMARLQQAGFAVEPLRFGEVDNFWATRGSSGPLLVFAGHTDVVLSRGHGKMGIRSLHRHRSRI